VLASIPYRTLITLLIVLTVPSRNVIRARIVAFLTLLTPRSVTRDLLAPAVIRTFARAEVVQRTVLTRALPPAVNLSVLPRLTRVAIGVTAPAMRVHRAFTVMLPVTLVKPRLQPVNTNPFLVETLGALAFAPWATVRVTITRRRRPDSPLVKVTVWVLVARLLDGGNEFRINRACNVRLAAAVKM